MNFAEYLDGLPLLDTWDDGKNWNTGGFHKWHQSQLHGLLIKAFIQGTADAGRPKN
jgi:hypothetical protein